MQGVRGSNPLSSTPGQRLSSASTILETPAFGGRLAAIRLARRPGTRGSWSRSELFVRVRLSSLTLNDGSSVELADPGVTVVVGPNNSGKTLLLREIMMLVAQERPNPEPRKILSAVDIRKEGPASELLDWLTERGFTRPRDPRTRARPSKAAAHSGSPSPPTATPGTPGWPRTRSPPCNRTMHAADWAAASVMALQSC